MSTRCYILNQVSENQFQMIYCHSDGYLSHVGAILARDYATSDKRNALFALGDLSSLDSDTDSCVAYARDRGESETDAMLVSQSELDAMKRDDDCNVDFIYICQANSWTAFSTHNKKVTRL